MVTRIVIIGAMRMVLALGAVGCAAVALSGCGGSASQAATSSTSVVAGFYPLAWAAEAIGGRTVNVTNLTPSGAEPHDIELTPREVAKVQGADVVLYLSQGFQPVVEKAVRDASGKRVDVLAGLKLRSGTGDEAGEEDPHVWLDPVLFARIVRRVGDVLGRRGPADALAQRVLRLDGVYRRGLSHCARREFVTSHAAFGYLAARYGLRQIPITGIDPEAEPSPRTLADLARLVRREHISIVFFERLVPPKLAETVAREAGAKTAVLDPIEGLTPEEARGGATYLSLMLQNLAALRATLGCR
jgi:zinc transport system substrate-binding protein